jgi:hypothetical protein
MPPPFVDGGWANRKYRRSGNYHAGAMAAASTNFNPSWATRPITSTRSRSRVLVAVLFNKTSLAGGLSLRGHF